MRSLRFLLMAGMLAAAAVAVPAVASAAPIIPAVAPPPLARIGETYVTQLPGLPAGVEECELFLLPDDGSGRMIQLTPEREADEGPLRWRMPRVRAKSARLVLRAGGRFGETESAPSAPFEIAAEAPPERAEILRGEDELAWHFGGPDHTGDASLQSPGGATIGAAHNLSFAAEPPRGPVAELPARIHSVAGVAIAAVGLDGSAPLRSRRPAFVPMRN